MNNDKKFILISGMLFVTTMSFIIGHDLGTYKTDVIIQENAKLIKELRSVRDNGSRIINKCNEVVMNNCKLSMGNKK
jgi:hypothetical protein